MWSRASLLEASGNWRGEVRDGAVQYQEYIDVPQLVWVPLVDRPQRASLL